MSRLNLFKPIGVAFILIVLGLKNETVMADSPDCSLQSKTPQGGTIKVNGYQCNNAYPLASADCISRGLGDASRVSLVGIPSFHYEYECDGKNQSETIASKKYYEYKAINEKEFAKRKEVETAYDPSGKGGYTPEKISSASTTVAFSDLQSAKKQCAELGFKPKTEKFGSCVLELRKRSQNNQSATIQPQKNPVQSQFKPIGDGSSDDATCQRYGFTPQTDAYGQCRMQIDNAKREMQAQQAQYAEQQKQYQDEVYRQRSLKQAEFFARFGSGETPNEALINTWGNGVVKPRQIPTTRTYILPGGRVMSCTTTGDVTSCF
jgi:hypothetical protein